MNAPPAIPSPQLQRLQSLLGGPALQALRQRLRRAYEQAAEGGEPARLTLTSLSAAEAECLQALTGRPPRSAGSMRLDLQALSQRLRQAELATGLRDALEQLDGPIHHLAAQQASTLQAWQALPSTAGHPALAMLLAQPRGLGLLKRLAGQPHQARVLCQGASRVLAALPAHGQARASLAAHCLGDAHALDAGQAVAALVLAALRLNGQDDGDEGVRVLWASQGVSVNELARPALSLNLSCDGQASHGEPRYWSLRQLLRQPPAWQVAGQAVYVCENPNLVAMVADSLGPASAPLVCTDGMPAAAQRALLSQLVAAGAQLHHHGDFDWAGIRIANRVVQDFGAQAWRMHSADYALACSLRTSDAQAPLHGAPVPALWDTGLQTAMQQAHCAIAEEALLAQLLPDLAAQNVR
jgi:uncharacterized protein (TIGR02679 family)